MRRTLFLLLGLAACSRTPAEPSGGSPSATASGPAPSSSTAASPPRPVATPTHPEPPPPLAIQWEDPHRWQKRVPSTPMRSAEWRVPRVAPDREDAECFVITFGKGQGGSIDDNVNRWVKQLEPTTSAMDKTTRTVHGMTVTRVEVVGTYTPMQMPGMPPDKPRPGYRLVGEIVDAPSGLWFFKLTGPDATAKAGGKELDALVDSIKPI